MVQEHEKKSDKTLNQHKSEWAGSKIIFMYSAHHTVEVKQSQETAQLFREGGICRATIWKNNQMPYSFRLFAL